VALEAATLFYAGFWRLAALGAESSNRARWPSYFLCLILLDAVMSCQPLLRLKREDVSIGFQK
jgi:hypothetical protein